MKKFFIAASPALGKVFGTFPAAENPPREDFGPLLLYQRKGVCDMQLIADLHTHTLASQHAYSTILENVRCAAEAGIQYLGWTDHAPDMIDGAHSWHFGNLYAVPETLSGVRILKGVEADVVSLDGKLDMPDESLARLEWVAVSIHSPLLPPGTVEEHTAVYLAAAKNPYVDMIAHSGSPDYVYDYDTVVKALRDEGKVLEINEHTFDARKASVPNCTKLAALCKKYGCRIAVNSDAHFATQIGRFPQALKMLEELSFPQELILNASPQSIEAYLREKKARLSRKS